MRLTISFLFASLLIAQESIIFRYNSDPTCFESVTAVEISNLSVEERVDSTELVARGNDGWGFSKRYTTLFEHDSSLIESLSELIITFSGPHAISGEIWCKSSVPDG